MKIIVAIYRCRKCSEEFKRESFRTKEPLSTDQLYYYFNSKYVLKIRGHVCDPNKNNIGIGDLIEIISE